MKKIVINISVLFIIVSQSSIVVAQQKTINQKVDSVLRLMTLEEKIGQLNQYNDDWKATGPVTVDNDKANQIRKGQVGSLLNCCLLYTSPSPRDRTRSRMPYSA